MNKSEFINVSNGQWINRNFIVDIAAINQSTSINQRFIIKLRTLHTVIENNQLADNICYKYRYETAKERDIVLHKLLQNGEDDIDEMMQGTF